MQEKGYSELENFLLSHYDKKTLESLEHIGGGGSNRIYYRFYNHKSSYILVENTNISENEAFIYFTETFEKIVDFVPTILHISSDKRFYIQTDLGKETLLQLLERDKDEALKIYPEILSQLIKIQIEVDKKIDYSRCYSYQKFDETLVLRDLFYFKFQFLNLCDINFQAGKLLEDFSLFAKNFAQLPLQKFCYRDFQGRNIMLKDHKAFFIDYQGGLKGPMTYDLVSLLWQAKADLSDEIKSVLKEKYFFELEKQIPISREQFEECYTFCLVLRLLQVLGAYGFKGLVEKKSHFIESIAFGLKNLSSIKKLDLLNDYPELLKVINQLTEPKILVQLLNS